MTTMVQPRPVTPESEQEHPLLEALKALPYADLGYATVDTP